MQRFGQVIRVKPESIQAYELLHKYPWPEVLVHLQELHIHNYSIFRYDEWLFAYFEYHGTDYQAEIAQIGDHPVSQAWHQLTDPMQEPLETRAPGEWWTMMKEVFHTD